MRKELLYPQFLEILKFEEDPFWKSIFEEMAYGICPYGSYLNKGFLCCNFKGKEFNYKIENSNDEKLYQDVKNLLFKKVGIQSSLDRIKNIEDFKKSQEELSDILQNKWSSIKKKSLKDHFIENYVIDCKKTYNLTDIEVKKLLFLIHFGILFKKIQNKDIKYENGKILSIDGIEISEDGKVNCDIIFSDYESVQSKIKFVEKQDFRELWEKYIKNRSEKNILEL